MKYIILSLLVSNTLFAATEKTISVDGNCIRRVVSDRGAIVVTADHLDKDLRHAVQMTTQAYEKVREAVKRLGLESLELETAEYSVQEAKEWVKDRSISKGFRARMGLRVTTSNIQKMGEVIAIAGREGIRDVGSLSTFLSREKLKEEQMACLQEAASHARAKAEKLAASLNSKVGGVISVSERIDHAGPAPVYAKVQSEALSADAPMAAPNIESAKQEVNVTVQASFELK